MQSQDPSVGLLVGDVGGRKTLSNMSLFAANSKSSREEQE